MAKGNTRLYRRKSTPVARSTGMICDQIVRVNCINSKTRFPEQMRRIKYRESETGKVLVFPRKIFALSPKAIAALYRSRWKIELFPKSLNFEWIKQHLRIKSRFSTSEKVVKSEIWIDVSVYVIIAIIRKRLHIDESMHTTLQNLDLTLYEKTTIK